MNERDLREQPPLIDSCLWLLWLL